MIKNRGELDFLRYLVEFIEAKTVIEIGVQYGETGVHLCKAASTNEGRYIGFDMWSIHGLNNQFPQFGSKESVIQKYLNEGLNNFTLIQIDTINNRQEFINQLKTLCPNGIDFAFIDADHSYKGISNDFFAIYPLLNLTGVIAFHDTAKIDGCREFILHLRTKYNDGTFDISEFPFGYGKRHCGVTLLTKRSFAMSSIAIDEVCGSLSEAHDIENQEIEWFSTETKSKKVPSFEDTNNILTNKIGFYNDRNKFQII